MRAACIGCPWTGAGGIGTRAGRPCRRPGPGGDYRPCRFSHASMSAISVVWSAMIFRAIACVAGSRAYFSATSAMATAPLWCGIMCVRKSTSGSPV